MENTGKIYYITRTWADRESANNAAIYREVYAEILKKIAPVIIVTPQYHQGTPIINDLQVCFPYDQSKELWDSRFQRLGIKEDYLDDWVYQTYRYLEDYVGEKDILFAISGGELSCIKLGALLKRKCGCKLVIHFHDPIDGVKIHGCQLIGYKGINRRRIADKYVRMADLMITTAESFKEVLSEWYPEKRNFIFNHYLGYVEKVEYVRQASAKKILNIVYAGAFSVAQNAEILYKALAGQAGVTLTFICDQPELRKSELTAGNVKCIGLMPHKQYLDYMIGEADIGFVSLTGEYLGNCVPSKIYEYINLQLPILASLPEGSAKHIIEDNGYGVVGTDGSILDLQEGLLRLLNKELYNSCLENIKCDRDRWFYKHNEDNFIKIIKKIEEI